MVIVSAGSGNWSAGATWVGGVKPGPGDDVEIAAGHTVTLDEDTALLGPNGIKNVSGSNTSVLDISGTVTINGNVTYSGNATTGFVIYDTGDVLTINGQVAQVTAGGYCCVGAGSGQLVISNVGGTAVNNSAGGCGVYHNSTGALTVTGAVVASGNSGYGIYARGNATSAITGNVSAKEANVYGIYISSGTMTLDGELGSATDKGPALGLGGGTVNWTGNRTLAASANAFIRMGNGRLNLATASAKLALANSGTFVIHKEGGSNYGTLSSADAGAGAASIVNQTATSYAAIIGGTDEQKAIIVGPTIPAVENVEQGTQYGYSGDLQTGTLQRTVDFII